MNTSTINNPGNDYSSDYLIIGSGIVGMAIAKALKKRQPDASVTIVDKEDDTGFHSSGRNSGVLHSGFYYTSDSLKARFTRDGNRAWTQFCEEKGLPINKCQKVVVAADESEVAGIQELYSRGLKNGVDVSIVDEKELAEIDGNVRTCEKALYSPTTSTVDPVRVCHALKTDLEADAVRFIFSDGYASRLEDNSIRLGSGKIVSAGKIINCAGLYADKIARDFEFGSDYTIIPFKGIYLKYTGKDMPLKTNVYPVPNLKNPFLGVHYTITVDGTLKIGPTAIPAFWRENYVGLERFNLSELGSILGYESKLFYKNAFGFRALAFEEMRKYHKQYFISLAEKLVKKIDGSGFNEWSKPGIRAQLLNVNTMELVQDFIVEADHNSVHVLNAVSPAFTAALPFGEWVVDNYVINKRPEG